MTTPTPFPQKDLQKVKIPSGLSSVKVGDLGVVGEGGKGLVFSHFFSDPSKHPYDEVTWVRTETQITNEKGKVLFEQKDVEFPDFWSPTAIKIVVSRYFRGTLGTAERETSLKQVIDRIVKTIRKHAEEASYFRSKTDAEVFERELIWLMTNQYACFNSPVLFNVGTMEKPQTSACFILRVEDTMESILQWYYNEGLIFRLGSGSGVALSRLRADKEALKGGGMASGPVSFMRGADAMAGAVKSGGKTRRAAKMVILDADHPDIEEFIWCKATEEKKARVLAEAGYDMGVGSHDWNLMQYQNANNSVRVTDDFMNAVLEDGEFSTHFRTNGAVAKTYRARELMRQIADAAWQSADPGMQFDTTINKWHTCSNTDRIYASNPCSEYMFLDDTSCNLASLNLLKFRTADGGFDTERFREATRILSSAMEMLILFSGYPTERIGQMTQNYRTLGIGFANLGALLMASGFPYDSDQGRNYAAAIMSLLSGEAYAQSARIASFTGPFAEYQTNAQPMMNVIQRHRYHAYEIPRDGVPENLLLASRAAWDRAVELGELYGFRNAQISVLAPTGTIAFFMDCDTTGVEPDIALVRYKWLVEKGMMKIVNQTVPLALETLGYSEDQKKDILAYLTEHDTIEGAPHLKEEHLAVFDCAFKPANGKRSIHYTGHIKMMAAVQPFVSGAISKTVNLPESASVEDVENVFIEGWKLGLKAIAVYRDSSKNAQIYTTTKKKAGTGKSETPLPEGERHSGEKVVIREPYRKRLPDERQSVTHKFSIAGHEGFVTVGLYEDGTPGEVFINMTKVGSAVYGLMHAFALSVSLNLQYGVPLRDLVRKFAHTRFEPAGFTKHANIRVAKSIIDYIFRWMAWKFLPANELADVGLNNLVDQPAANALQEELPFSGNVVPAKDGALAQQKHTESVHTTMIQNQQDAPFCSGCGSTMVRNGTCYKCINCGETTGCS